jgi:glutathione synthase
MKNNRKPHISLKIGFVMDPMGKLDMDYDSSISIMTEARRRGHKIYYLEPGDLFVIKNEVFANARQISIPSRAAGFQILSRKQINLKSLDIVFNRKDPPFDLAYLYLTQVLELIEPKVFVVNSPSGVRNANEKLSILEFPKWIPPTVVTNNPEQIEVFQKRLRADLIVKPLDQKGGAGIKLLKWKSANTTRLLNQMTKNGTKWLMAQKFLKRAVRAGDKRILLLNGKILGQFHRIPMPGEFRANLCLGGNYKTASLTARERSLVREIAPALVRKGLYFAGIDVIDGFLIEINVTSPAGITVIDELEKKRVEVEVLNFLEQRVSDR